jgi:hypothetical protein
MALAIADFRFQQISGPAAKDQATVRPAAGTVDSVAQQRCHDNRGGEQQS